MKPFSNCSRTMGIPTHTIYTVHAPGLLIKIWFLHMYEMYVAAHLAGKGWRGRGS